MITFKDLVNHPFSFAIGVGVANGLLAVGRGKSIDKPTAVTLSLILGLGEMALVAFEPESERPMSLTAIGLWSVAGVAVGVMPFIKEHKVLIPETDGSSPSSFPSLPIAANAGGGSTAVSGWSRNGTRSRAVVPRRRRRS